MMKDRSHDEAMAELYREDPVYAMQLLDTILADGDQEELEGILIQMAMAFDGVKNVADKGPMNQTLPSNTSSSDDNISLRKLLSILKAMGLRLTVRPLPVPSARI